MRIPTRRAVLGTGLALTGSGLLAACSGTGTHTSAKPTAAASGYVSPDGKEVAAAEAARNPGPVRKVKLTATPATVDLGARTVKTWTYDGELPGKEVRVTAGDTLALTLANHLPDATSLHWHGLALRNDMDGVRRLTTPEIRSGGTFVYRFAAPHPGTYWFHPHTGVQQERGLYAPLIIEDPKEPLKYDREWVVVLDDWVDGVDGATPDTVMAELAEGMGHMHGGHGGGLHTMPPKPGTKGPSHMLMGASSPVLGNDAGGRGLPVLPGQRAHPGQPGNLPRQAWRPHPHPVHQRRR